MGSLWEGLGFWLRFGFEYADARSLGLEQMLHRLGYVDM